MPQIIIDPGDQEYDRHLTRMIAAFDYIRPRLRHWHVLDPGEQAAWLAEDQLLRRAVKFAERFAKKAGFEQP